MEKRAIFRGEDVWKNGLLFMRNFLIIFLMSSMSLYANQVTMAQKISIKVNNVNLKAGNRGYRSNRQSSVSFITRTR